MAHPRIFVSSTYYDMKHIRSSLEIFLDSLGFESILSEKGHIAYLPDIPLDESCYREVENADIFVMIIGGRYGSEKSGNDEMSNQQFYDRYDSISKQEYKSAVERDIPIYILIEKSVYYDYETFLKNKSSDSINYAHVDSINIFYLIEDILSQPRNNPVHQFDRYYDIEVWLKEQWAGLFRDLINQRSKQTQITSLTSQINQLEMTNIIMKRYLEEVISKVSPEDSERLIADESRKLEEFQQDNRLLSIVAIADLNDRYGISLEEIKEIISSKSFDDFINKLHKYDGLENVKQSSIRLKTINEIQEGRIVLGLDPFEDISDE